MEEKKEQTILNGEIKLYIKNEADKARNQAIGVFAFIGLVIGIAGSIGINQLIGKAAEEAINDPAFLTLKTKVENTLKKAEIAKNQMETIKLEMEKAISKSNSGAPDFESDWMKVKYKNQYSVAHNLGQVPRRYTIFFSEDPIKETVHLANQIWAHEAELGRGVMITHITSNKLTLRTGAEWLFDSYPVTGKPQRILSREGYIKIMCWQ